MTKSSRWRSRILCVQSAGTDLLLVATGFGCRNTDYGFGDGFALGWLCDMNDCRFSFSTKNVPV